MKTIEILNNKNPLFEYYAPLGEYKGLISIPHSGLEIPAEFKPFLLVTNQEALQQDVDFYVHELIDIPKLQQAGIAIIKSNVIRVAVDLNRSPEKTVLNWKSNSRGVEIVTKLPTESEEISLKNTFYNPYYEMLKALINELKSKMRIASVIDLHSMPSKATEYHMQYNPNQKVDRPDFCLSDQRSITCEPKFINDIKSSLNQHYKEVLINEPYLGGYVTDYINNSFENTNNIQIEINRNIYMDESTFLLKEQHKQLQPILTNSILNLFEDFYKKYKY